MQEQWSPFIIFSMQSTSKRPCLKRVALHLDSVEVLTHDSCFNERSNPSTEPAVLILLDAGNRVGRGQAILSGVGMYHIYY